jgi:hypothetical protein
VKVNAILGGQKMNFMASRDLFLELFYVVAMRDVNFEIELAIGKIMKQALDCDGPLYESFDRAFDITEVGDLIERMSEAVMWSMKHD